jgi:hypothetical protein
MLFPLSDGVCVVFFRGMVFGFIGGLVLILLFFWSSGKYGALAVARPIGFVYFLAGLARGRHRLNRSDCVPWLECSARLGAPHDRPIETRRRVIATRLAGRFCVPVPKLPVRHRHKALSIGMAIPAVSAWTRWSFSVYFSERTCR